MLQFFTTLLVTSALAVAPASVTGIEGTQLQNGDISLTWDTPVETDISHYQVYYSSQSILDNWGLYDEFEITQDAIQPFTFTPLILSDEIFITMLAVNTDGEESEVFGEEIVIGPDTGTDIDSSRDSEIADSAESGEAEEENPLFDDTPVPIDLYENPLEPTQNPLEEPVEEVVEETEPLPMEEEPLPLPPVEESVEEAIEELPAEEEFVETILEEQEEQNEQVADDQILEEMIETVLIEEEIAAEPEPEPQPEPRAPLSLHLLSAETISPQDIALTFSHSLELDASRAPEALEITDAEGRKLAIVSISITGETLNIQTEPQVRSRVYNVKVQEPLQGIGGVPLDFSSRSALVIGHNDGTSVSQPSVPLESSSNEVSNVTVTPTSEPNGYFTVTATWDLPTPLPQSIVVLQTRDGGQSFAAPQILPGNTPGVVLHGVSPGPFGLAIQTVNNQNQPSQGMFGNVQLGSVQGTCNAQLQPPTPTPHVPHTPPPTPLTQSGRAPFAAGIILAGALTGWTVVRKRSLGV